MEDGEEEEDNDLAMLRRLVRDYGMRTAADRTEIGVGMLRECHEGSRELSAERVAKLVAFGQGQPDRGEERTEDGMWSEYADGEEEGKNGYAADVEVPGDAATKRIAWGAGVECDGGGVRCLKGRVGRWAWGSSGVLPAVGGKSAPGDGIKWPLMPPDGRRAELERVVGCMGR